jgi:hypothetical protein
MPIDSSLISRKIDEHGELVTVQDIDTRTYSEFGDLINNTTTEYTSIPAIFNTYGRLAGFQTEGVFQEGDVSFFFKGEQEGISANNLIVRSNGEVWKIKRVYPSTYRGTIMVQEARVSNN